MFLKANVPTHNLHIDMKITCGLRFELLKHYLYSSNLALFDNHIFPQLKKSLKGSKISFIEDVIEAVEALFAKQDKAFFLKDLEALVTG